MSDTDVVRAFTAGICAIHGRVPADPSGTNLSHFDKVNVIATFEPTAVDGCRESTYLDPISQRTALVLF